MAISFISDSSAVRSGYLCTITATGSPSGGPGSQLACGDHTLAEGTYTIKSPNHPGDYPQLFDCSYNMALGSGVGSLSLSCSAFNIEHNLGCTRDWLKVDGTNYCGRNAPSAFTNNAMAISFHSGSSTQRSGYLCHIAAKPLGASSTELACGDHTLAAGTYTIKSPHHPGNYIRNFDCNYNLALGSGVGSLNLSCSAFNIEHALQCRNDWLQVGNTKYCGTTAPFVNSNDALAISFHSNYDNLGTGYFCTITAMG